MAAVASQPNPSAYPSQLRVDNPGRHRAAKYSASGHLQHSPPSKPQYSLFTATPMTVPANAIATEPPQAAHNVRAQILAGIQEVGSRGGQIPNPSTSIFRINISISHPLKPLLDKSLDTILQAVSPRTQTNIRDSMEMLQSRSISLIIFRSLNFLYSITSFISFLNSIKCLQVSSIKGYISGLQFFHKLLYGAPSPDISNSQTAMLIRGIQRTRPTRSGYPLP